MSKNNKKNPQEVEAVMANSQGKTVEELKQIAQTLQAQLQDHNKQANHHQTMAVKAQGALEVILQLIPKEEVKEMISQEAQENRENGELVES
jgi:tRNA nucleotidyltransferase/poly(A) polymerase